MGLGKEAEMSVTGFVKGDRLYGLDLGQGRWARHDLEPCLVEHAACARMVACAGDRRAIGELTGQKEMRRYRGDLRGAIGKDHDPRRIDEIEVVSERRHS